MKHIVILLTLTAFSCIALKAQIPTQPSFSCGFSNDLPWGSSLITSGDCDDPIHRDTAIYSPGDPILVLHLILHIVRDDFGNGPGPDEVAALMNKVHEDFRGITASTYSISHGLGWGSHDTGIDFTYEAFFHDSTALLYAPYTSLFGLSTLAPGSGPGIPVYVNLEQNNVLGFGKPWVVATTINGSSAALTHELGHKFYLLHTFVEHAPGFCLGGEETLCMTKPTRDGVIDQCWDTEPDFRYGGCGVAGNDCCGQPLDPMVRKNFMSYSDDACKARFTPQQSGRMRCYIQNEFPGELIYGALSFTAPIADFKVSRRDVIAGVPITFVDSSYGASTCFWEFGDGSTLLSPGGVPVSHTYTSSGDYTVRLTVSDLSGHSNSYTRDRAVRVSSGYSLPYSTNFNSYPALTGGWSSNDADDNIFQWRALEGLRFNNSAAIIVSTTDLQRPVDQTIYTSCKPSFTQYVIGRTGTPTKAMYTDSRIFDGVSGDQDVLVSPVISLAAASDPQLHFFWSHIPSADTNAAVSCDVVYPGLPVPCGIPSCTNPLNSSCGWPVDSYIENRLEVMVSKDLGATWTTVWDRTGPALNTVSSETCVQFHFAPTSASQWSEAVIDLCGFVGTPILVQWVYTNDYAQGNLYLDDVQFTTAAPTLTASTSVTPDTCGKSVGVLTLNVPAFSGLSASLYSGATLLDGPIALSSAIVVWDSLPAGIYSVVLTDGVTCRSIADTIPIVMSLLATSSSTPTTCDASNGTITASVPSTGSSSYTFTLFQGVTLAGGPKIGPFPSHTFSGLGLGIYTITITDSLGNCGEVTDTIIRLTTDTLSTLIVGQSCLAVDGSITVVSPVSPDFTYELNNLGTGAVIVNPTGVFTSLASGDYLLYATDSMGHCAEDTLLVPDNSFAGYVMSTAAYCYSGGLGQIEAGSLIAGGTYTYYLSSGGMIIDSVGPTTDSTHFWNVPAGLYEVYIVGSGPVAGGKCYLASVTVVAYGVGALPLGISTSVGKCADTSANTITLNTFSVLYDSVFYTITPLFAGGSSFSSGGIYSPLYSYSVSGVVPGTYEIYAFGIYTPDCFTDTITIVGTEPCCIVPGNDYLLQDEPASDVISFFGGSPSISDKIISVNGTWTIDTDCYLIDCDVYLAPYAVIDIQPGIIFAAYSGTRFLPCGDTMWNGIYARAGSVMDADSATFRGAETAITCKNCTTYLSRNIFNLNYRHILYDTSTTAFAELNENTFNCSNPLFMLAPHVGERSFVGIEMRNAGSIDIASTAAGYGKNNFTNLSRGILAYKTNVTILKNRFDNMVAGPPTTASPAGRAIYAEGYKGLSPIATYTLIVGDGITAHANDLNNCIVGVEARYGYNVTVNRNTFSNSTAGIALREEYFRTHTITQNTLNTVDYGIRLTACSGSVSTITKNTITNPISHINTTGIGIEDIAVGSSWTTTNTQIEQNVLTLHGRGIFAQAAPGLRIFNNDISIRRVSGTLARGILIDGCITPVANTNRVNSIGGGGLIFPGIQGLFVQNTNEGIYSCNEFVKCQVGIKFQGPAFDSQLWGNTVQHADSAWILHSGALIGQQGAPGFPAGNKWIGSFPAHIYSVKTNASSVHYYARNTGTQKPTAVGVAPLGAPVTVDITSGTTTVPCPTYPIPLSGGGAAASLKLAVATSSVPLPSYPGMTRVMSEHWLYNHLKTDPGLLTSHPAYTTSYAHLDTMVYRKLYSVENNLAGGAISGAGGVCSTITCTYPIEHDFKMTLGRIIACIESGDEALSAADSLLLLDISLKCSMEFGAVVYMARTVFSLKNPQFTFTDDCSPHGSSRVMNEFSQENIVLSAFPNPVSNILHLSLSAGKGTVTIVDMQGKLLFAGIALSEERETEIDLSLLPSGVYILHALVSDQEAQDVYDTQKLITVTH